MASYEDIAKRQEERFQLFATAVAGERALASAAGMPVSSIKKWSRAASFRDALLADAKAELGRFFQEYMGDSEPMFVERSEARLALALSTIKESAAQTLKQSNRAQVQSVDAISGSSGALGQLAQSRLANPQFKVSDSSGRTWDADKLIYVVVRDFAYQTYVDHQFDMAIRDGASEVTIIHKSQSHELNGETIDLSDNWIKERDEVFHVNSNLTITYVTLPTQH